MTLMLWKMELPYSNFDEFDAFVIAAITEQECREFASMAAADEGGDVWQHCSCVAIGIAADDVQAGVILGSFNAG